ncbi:hypothetical protein [Hydrogenimonas sp.]
MKLYYYVHTGHRVGLDRLRRSAPVIKTLEAMGLEPKLLVNDFRAGEYAREHFGIARYVSVDVVRNIANLATPADALVFDSEEEGRGMWEDMAGYFRAFVRISDDPEDEATKESGLVRCPDIVDPRYFQSSAHDGGDVYFWGDADYEMALRELAGAFDGLDMTLLEGYYFFMQYGDELAAHFAHVADSETYDETLTGAGRFLTSSPQSALEALAAGSKPIYLEKPGASSHWRERLAAYGIPVLEKFSADEISRKLRETAVYSGETLRNDAPVAIASYIKDKLS